MNAAAPEDLVARVNAILRALATGDAIGRATEHYTPDEIVEVYEDIVTDFVEPVRLFDQEEWREGETGAPTQIVLEAAGSGGRWPGASGATVAHLPAGVALGLATPVQDLVEKLAEPPALAAIAAAVSAALSGHPPIEVVAAGSRAARIAGDDHLAGAILDAGGVAQASGGRLPGRELRRRFPPDNGVASVVPFIFGIVYGTQSARRAIVEAVNQGGHAPETAAIAGAVCAGFAPMSLPAPWGAVVERVNGLDLEAVARRYIAVRGG